MSDEAAILAQFSDWRTVKGRKVLQLIFEVPLEDQAKVLSHLGAPMPMADLWCGIARVKKGATIEGDATNSVTPVGGETGEGPSPLSLAPPVPKPKRRWSEMPPSQRAGMILSDPLFEDFWRQYPNHRLFETGEDWLKSLCGVTRKRDIDMHNNAFLSVEGDFRAWKSARGHGAL